MKTLDLATLRAFVLTAELGGPTKAGAHLNLTQSAISMQVKRLEETLGQALFDRAGRRLVPTASGQRLLGYARRLIALHDEAVARLTADDLSGEVALGAPCDIVFPYLPNAFRQFDRAYPRVDVKLNSAPTVRLKQAFARGELEIILTTEQGPPDAHGEPLQRLPLIWFGAPDGQAWRSDPLPLAFAAECIFIPVVLKALETAGLSWRHVVETQHDISADSVAMADMGVRALLDTGAVRDLTPVAHGGGLPELGDFGVHLYLAPQAGPIAQRLAEFLRHEISGER